MIAQTGNDEDRDNTTLLVGGGEKSRIREALGILYAGYAGTVPPLRPLYVG